MLETLFFALGLKRPYGSEGVLRDFLMSKVGGEVDEVGNLHVSTSDTSKTLFTAHMDTVHSKDGANTFIISDGGRTVSASGNSECLGADDASGIAILVHLIQNNVPGHYIFTVGEECGCIGAYEIDEGLLSEFDRAIAFDRKGKNDLITHQKGRQMCSYEFGQALIDMLGMGHKFAHGVFTDNSSFEDIIPEIVNISSGYTHQHSSKETLDVEYLCRLADAAVKVDWESLPVGIIEEVEDYKWSYLDSWDKNDWGRGTDTWGGHPRYDDYPMDMYSTGRKLSVYDSIYEEEDQTDIVEKNMDAICRELQKSLGIQVEEGSWESFVIKESLYDAYRLALR